MDPRLQVNPDPRRALPSVDRLVRAIRDEAPDTPRWAATEAARRQLAAARAEPDPSLNDANMIAKATRLAESLARVRPRPVLNATGVVLHTNLGRAPMADGAAEAAAAAARGYSDLEFDVASGRRGDRLGGLATKLALLAGSEAAMACNNNAAALMLTLDTLARGREVVVSRGELVEIGGSFRVPDIMERAGVRLVEVGTTNRTHPHDYERAIGPDTALLLKVHRSNFEQSGFVREVDLATLVGIGRRHDLPVVEDLGSGTLVDLGDHGLPAEAHAPSRLRTGADLVCFSGDKLLGGPQAGLAIGRAEVVDAMRRNPLARALRLDKMTLAALDWTLAALLDEARHDEIPVLRSLRQGGGDIEPRARALADRLAATSHAGLRAEAEPDRTPVGGGSLPGFELDTWVVALRGGPGAASLVDRLRGADPPVIARVRDDALLLDCRTLRDEDLDAVVAAVDVALQPAAR